jgi:hypothetical protein
MKTHTYSTFSIILILLLSAFFLGCGGSSGPQEVTIYRTGTQGLVMAFHQGSPPVTVKENADFKILVDVANLGAYDISNGVIFLTNVVEQDLTLVDSKEKPLNLKGRSQDYPYGEKEFLSWSLRTKQVATPPIATQISLAAEYSYQTDTDINICIDPDLYGEVRGKKSCTMQEQIALSNGQGAPVAVSLVTITGIFDKSESSGQVDFKIALSNVGTGNIGSFSNPGQDAITAVVTLSGVPIQCDSSTIKLSEGNGELICHVAYDQKAETVKLMHVKLNYLYNQRLEVREISIIHNR